MTMTILQVTGKLKSNGKKQTVTGLAIEGSGEFFYSLISLEEDSLFFLSEKARFFYITKKTWLFFVFWNIYSDICATMLLFRWPSTHNFCYKTSWRWVWECESYSYLILSETVNVDQVNCGKVNYWYLDLKSIPPPFDYRRSSLARSQSAFWRTAVPYQRWSWNTTTRQIFYLKLSWSCRTCTLDRFTKDQIKIHVALCWFLVLGIIEIIVKCVCPKMFPSLRIRPPPMPPL